MNCDHARDSLSAYLDEALAPDERSLLDTHLAGCAACRHELETLRATVALLREVEPVRAPVGFADRVVAAARPRPWYRRVAAAMLLPLPIKLPLGATAVIMVGLLAVYLFDRTPELQRAAREVAPRQAPAAPEKERPAEQLADRTAAPPAPAPPAPAEPPARMAGERDRADAPGSPDASPAMPTSPPTGGAPSPPAAPAPPPAVSAPSAASPQSSMAAPSPEAKGRARKEASPGENVAGAARQEAESRPRVPAPRAAGDSARAAPSAAALAAKRVLSPADVVARVAVRDRDAAEGELTALVARLGGTVTQRRREDEATVVEAMIPQPRYAEFSDGVARIGSWQLEAQRQDLPAQIHVILRLQ
jgi:hypothetical protein